MADQTETILLEFTVDQGAAEKQLEKIEGILLDNKKAQQELTKAYKDGNITQKEYIQENIRLQANIKKEQQTKTTLIKTINTESNSRNALRQQISALVKDYDSLNQGSVKGVLRAKELESQIAKLSAQLTNGDKAAGLFKNQIGNYPQAFGEAAKSINIAGVSVGDIGTKLASFANPATAAIGILGSLGAAYARSTAGAKDLQFVQNQLSAAVQISTNAFANLFSSEEDGEGILTKGLNAFLNYYVPAIAAVTKAIALNIEKFEDLQREELLVREGVNDRLSENQELLTEINDEQTSLNRQLQLANDIGANLVNNKAELIDVNQKELEIIRKQIVAVKDKDAQETLINQKVLEISKIEAEYGKKIKVNDILKGNINQKLNEQIRLQKELDRLEQQASKHQNAPSVDTTQAGIDSIPLAVPKSSADNAISAQQELADNLLKVNKDYYDKDVQFKIAATKIKEQQDQMAIAAAANIAGEAASIFDEQTAAYKILASAQTLISTYSSATKSYDALADIPYIGPVLGGAAAAAAIASGLANVARINGIQFAEGGYTGPGHKYQAAGIVHAGEVVWSQKDVAMAGGPAAANSMRPTSGLRPYADGGFVTQQSISSTQQALITANAFKNLPSPVVSVKEVTRVQNRISARENISRLGS